MTDAPPRLLLKTTKDALLLLEASERGVFPRLVRRLTEQERFDTIRSGAVFVYEEYEAGIRRFTDMRIWSPSRIVGNYLVYREMREHEPRPTSRAAANPPLKPSSERSLARPRIESALNENDRARKKREQLYVGSLTNGDKFKPDGLIKKTFSLMGNGKNFRIIAYYTYEDAINESFDTPTEYQGFQGLTISSHLLKDASAFRVPPRIEKLPNGQLIFVGEDADRVEPSYTDPASPDSGAASLPPTNGTHETSNIAYLPVAESSSSNFDQLYALPPPLLAAPHQLPIDNWDGPIRSDLPAYSTKPASHPASLASAPSHTNVLASSFTSSTTRQVPPSQQHSYSVYAPTVSSQSYGDTRHAPATSTNVDSSYPRHWAIHPRVPRGHEIVAPVPQRSIHLSGEVGPSGERVEYDIPSGRWTPNSGMVLLYSDAAMAVTNQDGSRY